MYITPSFTFAELPTVGGKFKLYFTYINNQDHSLNYALVDKINIITGNVNIEKMVDDFYITPLDNNKFTLKCTGKYLINTEIKYIVSYFYSKAVNIGVSLNNYSMLANKFPKGVFSDLSRNSVIGTIIYATSKLIDDYSLSYKIVQQQTQGNDYNQDLEYELNGTKGLLGNSVFSNSLMRLLNSLATYQLNAYDMELFVSKYIWYRKKNSCVVYINEYVVDPNQCWILGSTKYSILGETTKLQDANEIILTKIIWTIFNSLLFENTFKQEIKDLIKRINRCDISNEVIFSNDPIPPQSKFNYIGFTYKNDPRLPYGKAIGYTGDQNYPTNIVGYQYKPQA
jgi:hypothetical protein